MKFILASQNKHKAQEFSQALTSIQILPAPIALDVDENGQSFIENARIKARAFASALGQNAIADDSGLSVDALDGAPGVHSARYAGEPCDDARNNAKLLEELVDTPDEERTARFVCTLVYLDEEGAEIDARGTIEGRIGYEARGEHGFGYDPLFYPDELGGISLAEVPGEDKNAISHRGNALRALKAKLDEK